MEQVILVDRDDQEMGTMEKMEAHERGVLHRAFSVFVFNRKGELMLQQRAAEKYHSGGLWTNTCCSHPRPGEAVEAAAHRRMQEEMGFDCPMEEKFQFVYKCDMDHGLTEHELDHVLFGWYDDVPQLNPEEVMDWKFISIGELVTGVAKSPESYTEWFKICLDEVLRHLIPTP